MLVDSKRNTRGAINRVTGLTEKEQQYAMAHIANEGNISKASLQVGISRVTATAYLKKQRVIDYIEQFAKASGDEVLSKQEVMVRLSQIADGKIKHQMVSVKDGSVVELEDIHAKVNALRQLSKIYGMEKTVVEQTTQTVFNIGFSTDEEDEERERKIIDFEVDYLDTDKNHS